MRARRGRRKGAKDGREERRDAANKRPERESDPGTAGKDRSATEEPKARPKPPVTVPPLRSERKKSSGRKLPRLKLGRKKPRASAERIPPWAEDAPKRPAKDRRERPPARAARERPPAKASSDRSAKDSRERPERKSRERPSKPRARKRPSASGARKRIGAAAATARRSSARGASATATRIRPAIASARSASVKGMHRAQPRFDWLLTLVPRAILWCGRMLAAIAATLAAAATRLSRVLTPERGIAAVIVGTSICLVVSQFVVYRGVEVGEPQYLGVAGIAPPPQTDRVVAGAAHAYLLIPVALAAVVLAVLTVRSRRWRLGRLVSLAGLIGIAVSLAIDMPKGLDTGTAGISFEGAHATLTDGFYAQLAASAVLVLCGLLLGSAVKRAGASEPRRSRRERSRHSRGGTALAGGKA